MQIKKLKCFSIILVMLCIGKWLWTKEIFGSADFQFTSFKMTKITNFNKTI